jgi:hypothetical protein
LFLHSRIFTNIANRMKNDKVFSHWTRNIVISRSKTVVDGVTHPRPRRDRCRPALWRFSGRAAVCQYHPAQLRRRWKKDLSEN